MSFFRVFVLGGALVLPACGSGVEQPPEVPAALAPEPSAEPQPELPEAAPAPEEIVALARVRNPAQVLEKVGEYGNLPLPWDELIREQLPAIGPLLNASAPMDFVGILDPAPSNAEPLFAFSVGLTDFQTSLDQLRGAGLALERISPFLYYLDVEKNLTCGVAQGLTLTAPRLVCSSERRSLDFLAPYMATRLQTEDLGSGDIRAVVMSGPFRARYGKKANLIKMGVPLALRELSMGQPRFDTALADALHASADELIALTQDLDELRFELTFDGQPERLRGVTELVFRGQKSWLSRLTTAVAAGVGPAPARFWTLPADATAAGFRSDVFDPALMNPVVHGVSELIAGALEMATVKAKLIDDWTEAYRKLGEVRGGSVLVSGTGVGADGQPATYDLSTSGQDDGAMAAFSEATVALLNDKDLRKFLTERVGDEIKQLPQVKTVRAPSTLPKGTLAYQVELDLNTLQQVLGNQGAPDAAAQKVQVNALLVPGGDTTWVAWGNDLELLVAKVNDQLSPRPSEATLASRPGLAEFRERRASVGVFTTPAGVVGKIDPSKFLGGAPAALEQTMVAAMPNGGTTPMQVWLEAESAAHGPSARMVWTIPQAAAQDVAAAFVVVAAQAASR